MCELRHFRIRCSMSTTLENELFDTKAQLVLCSLKLDLTKAQLDRSSDNILTWKMKYMMLKTITMRQ